jgi:hypothetical protein
MNDDKKTGNPLLPRAMKDSRSIMDENAEQFMKLWTRFRYAVEPSPGVVARISTGTPVTWEEYANHRGNSEDHRLMAMAMDNEGFARMLAYFGSQCFTPYPPRSYNEAGAQGRLHAAQPVRSDGDAAVREVLQTLTGHLLAEVVRRLKGADV